MRTFVIGLVLLAATETHTRSVAAQAPAAAPMSLEKQYRQRLAGLAPDDLKGHYALAEWSRRQGRHDWVIEQCRTVLALKPDHANARVLMEVAEQELSRMQRRRQNRPGAPGVSRSGPTGRQDYVSEQDIQRLRFAELNLDRPEQVKVKFHNRVPVRFANEMVRQGKFTQRDRTLFLRAKPAAKLFLILQHSEDEFRDDIEIRSDPFVFASFRKQVLKTVMAGCATSACHGGIRAPVFRLYSDKARSDQAVYTNFAILDSLTVADQPLLNRETPKDSLLLQYFLPRERAKYPHSTKIDPVVNTMRDRKYLVIADWISRLQLRRNYTLDWRPPDSPNGSASLLDGTN